VCILGDSSVIRYSYNVLYYFLPIYYEIIHEEINAGAIPEGVHFSELESETESGQVLQGPFKRMQHVGPTSSNVVGWTCSLKFHPTSSNATLLA
jgi:hypothetical protein